jgi:hypothetical protein
MAIWCGLQVTFSLPTSYPSFDNQDFDCWRCGCRAISSLIAAAALRQIRGRNRAACKQGRSAIPVVNVIGGQGSGMGVVPFLAGSYNASCTRLAVAQAFHTPFASERRPAGHPWTRREDDFSLARQPHSTPAPGCVHQGEKPPLRCACQVAAGGSAFANPY